VNVYSSKTEYIILILGVVFTIHGNVISGIGGTHIFMTVVIPDICRHAVRKSDKMFPETQGDTFCEPGEQAEYKVLAKRSVSGEVIKLKNGRFGPEKKADDRRKNGIADHDKVCFEKQRVKRCVYGKCDSADEVIDAAAEKLEMDISVGVRFRAFETASVIMNFMARREQLVNHQFTECAATAAARITDIVVTVMNNFHRQTVLMPDTVPHNNQAK